MGDRAGKSLRGWLMASVLVAAGGTGLCGQVPESPFRQPVGATPAPAVGDAEFDALQFSGLSVIGDMQSFNFVDARSRKSFWVPLNGTTNGYTVVSYDSENGSVVLQHGTRQRTLSLRKPVIGTIAAPAPARGTAPPVTTAAATPAAPAGTGRGVDEIKNPQTPEQIKQAEYEARMLVSDLLEISMRERARQREAREAQARAQGAAPANAPGGQR